MINWSFFPSVMSSVTGHLWLISDKTEYACHLSLSDHFLYACDEHTLLARQCIGNHGTIGEVSVPLKPRVFFPSWLNRVSLLKWVFAIVCASLCSSLVSLITLSSIYVFVVVVVVVVVVFKSVPFEVHFCGYLEGHGLRGFESHCSMDRLHQDTLSLMWMGDQAPLNKPYKYKPPY